MEQMQQLPPNANEDVGHRILVVIWFMFAITVPFVAVRIVTRARVIRSLGWDDWTILLAMVLSLATTIVSSVSVHYGLGHRIYGLIQDPHDLEMILKTSIISQPFSTFSSCFAKISVALLLKRMMNRNKAQEYFLYFIIASVFIVNLVLNVVTFTQCNPTSAIWSLQRKGNCLSPNVNTDLGIFQGAWSIFADVSLALFPILILWNLQVKRNVKIGIAILMSFGIFAAAAAAVRTYQVWHVSRTDDPIWGLSILVYTFTVENYLIIITACIPTLKPLYPRMKSLYSQYILSLLSSRSRGSRSGTAGVSSGLKASPHDVLTSQGLSGRSKGHYYQKHSEDTTSGDSNVELTSTASETTRAASGSADDKFGGVAVGVGKYGTKVEHSMV